MTGIFRDFARAFASYRRWHAGVLEQKQQGAGDRGPAERRADARRSAAVIDLAGARRVRCLSEPCGNTRLAIALLRAERRVRGGSAEFGLPR
jgi:hypothetical protein